MPLAPESARAILDGDLSGWTPAEGWPHKDTADGLRGVTGGSLGWLVTLDGAVIGDCGTLGGVRPSGDIEIGYGLAAPYRGQGYGTELVRALAGWLRARPGVRRVVAGTLPDNIASRRVLEHAGFTEDGVEAGEVRYALSSLGSTDE
ncbi:MAG TPA: GNAT family N-acetyltransferase [Rugosimonospora sp.]|nr:GNAT family N-acetyltransferase [Rugosimonospora sp.]